MPDQAATYVPLKAFLSDEPITWAGRFPRDDEFCLATESGELWPMDYSLRRSIAPLKVVGSGEAINGVAFAGDLMVVSTPGEVVIHHLEPGTDREYVYRGGAHGVIASDGGRVLAPMGRAGLLLIQRLETGLHARTTIKASDKEPYFYRTVQLGTCQQGVELFASAGRTDGVILTPIGPGQELGMIHVLSPNHSHDPGELDVVDLCSLNLPLHPRSLAFVGMDGSLHLSLDISKGDIKTIAFDRLKGTPYSLHCGQGVLFLLTSERLYAMQGVVDRLLSGDWSSMNWPTRSMDLDAVSCSIVDEEYLLIVLEDRVSLMLVGSIFGPAAEAGSGLPQVGGPLGLPSLANYLIDLTPGYFAEMSTEIMAF